MNRLFFLLTSLLTVLIISGCVVGGSESSISDGEIIGIEGWDIHAAIDCTPNTGRQGTPIKITIIFDLGGSLVNDIQTWQAYHETNWEYVRTPDIDPVKESTNSWTIWHNIFLSGEPGVVRFYALNGETRIAYGDIDVNGGKPDL
jgi:hypothetical protein